MDNLGSDSQQRKTRHPGAPKLTQWEWGHGRDSTERVCWGAVGGELRASAMQLIPSTPGHRTPRSGPQLPHLLMSHLDGP